MLDKYTVSITNELSDSTFHIAIRRTTSIFGSWLSQMTFETLTILNLQQNPE
jgi:hypothetical protein